MKSGDTRKRRDLMPSEKLSHGEDVMVCAERCVMEELSIADRERIDLVAASHIAWVEIVVSPSFPDLMTQYRLHQVECFLIGLPQGPFETDEAGGMRHYWEWREDTPNVPRRWRDALAQTTSDGKERQLNQRDKPVEAEARQGFEDPLLDVTRKLNQDDGADGEGECGRHRHVPPRHAHSRLPAQPYQPSGGPLRRGGR